MNNQEQIELIREKCIASNPEIVELKFGCEILLKYGDKERKAILVSQKHVGSWIVQFVECDDATFFFLSAKTITKREVTNAVLANGILGRPIRLADVLLAMHGKNVAVFRDGD